jgi:hypothetical protein
LENVQVHETERVESVDRMLEGLGKGEVFASFLRKSGCTS